MQFHPWPFVDTLVGPLFTAAVLACLAGICFLILKFIFRLFDLHVPNIYLVVLSVSPVIAFVMYSARFEYLADRRESLEVRAATRLFAGPQQYPPKDFPAYGIFAFRSRATSQDRVRYLMFCEAYVAVLLHTSEVLMPASQQMVTVWPIDSDDVATGLNSSRKAPCGPAVDNYGLAIGKEALDDATQAGVDVSDQGPYLLAWSPSTEKGKHDALVLVANLSRVTTNDEAKLRLLRWQSDILLDPKIWNRGWNLEDLRFAIREWANDFGPNVLVLFGGKK